MKNEPCKHLVLQALDSQHPESLAVSQTVSLQTYTPEKIHFTPITIHAGARRPESGQICNVVTRRAKSDWVRKQRAGPLRGKESRNDVGEDRGRKGESLQRRVL